MTAAESLAAWGIQRPADVVSLAADAGLPLAAAAALLEQESNGGHNVWGHDNVSTGGIYVPGAEVTAAAYRAYRAALAAKRIGQQGVGPCQLTDHGIQDAADKLGGCWEPIFNMRVGFGLLANYASLWGFADAYRAYNGGPGNRVKGSNVRADRYSDEAMAAYATWNTRLGTKDDMPLTSADAKLVVDTLLSTQLADLYPDKPIGSMSVGAHLQWAAANAGRAVTVAQRIRDTLLATPDASIAPAVRAELLIALHDLGPLYLVPDTPQNG